MNTFLCWFILLGVLGRTWALTFQVDPSVTAEPVAESDMISNRQCLEEKYNTVIYASESSNTLRAPHGLVSAALFSYSYHYNLVIKPDDVWIEIITSLSGYIDRHAEEMRQIFVGHDGSPDLEARGFGNIYTANYESLVDQIVEQIDSATKDDIKSWLECNFTTTTPVTRHVSKLLTMGTMKNYFRYKFILMCGLPSVTLEGTKEDWQEILNRIERMRLWDQKELLDWTTVLEFVLQKFVDAFDGKINTSWWNSITTRKEGESGPTFIEGWILSFMPFDYKGSYQLNDLDTILSSNVYGRLDVQDVANSVVEVGVKIDDSGVLYDTIIVAGNLMMQYDPEAKEIRS
eukprot:CAMPEP_0119135082 /NCGR_PEP_ID=MMETSP1310-20130426/18614_1 /TAXON_ID=464262 /ORGANISM="Genus nov. species nov., Strain RCC2339" /LENGTH=345 /DNA_ID=CAMNT_0007125937 /DNA_START=64 /DNA_END=1098 /DNA_ORIENTATION=-